MRGIVSEWLQGGLADGALVLTVDVGVEGVEPLLVGDLEDGLLHHLVGVVVEQDVDSAELVHGLVDDLVAVLLLSQVGREEVALAAVFLDLLLGLLCVLLLVLQVRDQYIGTLHGEENGRAAADARVTSGDDSLAALELAGGLVELGSAIPGRNLIVERLRLEIGLTARERLVLDLGLPACGDCQLSFC